MRMAEDHAGMAAIYRCLAAISTDMGAVQCRMAKHSKCMAVNRGRIGDSEGRMGAVRDCMADTHETLDAISTV